MKLHSSIFMTHRNPEVAHSCSKCKATHFGDKNTIEYRSNIKMVQLPLEVMASLCTSFVCLCNQYKQKLLGDLNVRVCNLGPYLLKASVFTCIGCTGVK